MKKLVCFLLAVFIVFTVYADTTYTAIAGETETPTEFKLQAYKNSPELPGEMTEIHIFNYVNDSNTQEELHDTGENRFIISEEKLQGDKLFDIVYKTNSFENHIDFTIDISMFILDEGEDTAEQIDVTPEITLGYVFSDPYKQQYISEDQNKTPDYKKNEDVTISKETFHKKYDNMLADNFKITESNAVDNSTSFSFMCYPKDSNEKIKIIKEEEGFFSTSYNMTYYAYVTFNASAAVSLPEDFKPNDYNGRYVMHVNIRAEISGS